jgi:citrate synthase
MKQSRYLTAQEAADELGIKPATLYAYVSRGLIRSEATGDSQRKRRYLKEDVQKLKERREARRNPSQIAEGALNWGTPVLESALTLIANHRFYYRGYDALTLARTHTVEQVATLIWLGELSTESSTLFGPVSNGLPAACQKILPKALAEFTSFEAFQILLPVAAADDVAAYDLRPAAVAQTGVRVMRLLTAIAVDGKSSGSAIAETLQQAWVPADSRAAVLLNAALILCADHELNVSSFTARCVASAGSTPYAVVMAGLSALQGIKHGGYTERVEVLFREIEAPEKAQAALGGRLKRGETIPGFGQRLYPEGDPRYTALVQLIAEIYPDSPALALATSVAEAAYRLIGERPTIDFGLVTLARTLNLRAGAPLTLFALGRTIGWLGHAIEQYQADQLIRPRARYVGEQPA